MVRVHSGSMKLGRKSLHTCAEKGGCVGLLDRSESTLPYMISPSSGPEESPRQGDENETRHDD